MKSWTRTRTRTEFCSPVIHRRFRDNQGLKTIKSKAISCYLMLHMISICRISYAFYTELCNLWISDCNYYRHLYLRWIWLFVKNKLNIIWTEQLVSEEKTKWRKARLKRMNLEIMNLMLNENAIQFFRGIRNIFNEKWQFTGQGSADRDGYGPRWSRTEMVSGRKFGWSIDPWKRARNRNKRKTGFKSDYKGIWKMISHSSLCPLVSKIVSTDFISEISIFQNLPDNIFTEIPAS